MFCITPGPKIGVGWNWSQIALETSPHKPSFLCAHLAGINVNPNRKTKSAPISRKLLSPNNCMLLLSCVGLLPKFGPHSGARLVRFYLYHQNVQNSINKKRWLSCSIGSNLRQAFFPNHYLHCIRIYIQGLISEMKSANWNSIVKRVTSLLTWWYIQL
jgi:hypothetical protein